MAIVNFPARVRFTNSDGTLTPEALRLLGAIAESLGGALGENGEEVFANVSAFVGGIESVFCAEMAMQPDTAQPHGVESLAPMLMQPVAQPQCLAPMEFQPAPPSPTECEMVMQPATSEGAPFVAVTPGASPYAYAAAMPGALSVQAGTISAITLARAGVAVTITGATLVPVTTGDTVTITYTVAPTVNFLPR